MKKTVILTTHGKLTEFVYHGIKDLCSIQKVIFEEVENYESTLKKRRKRIGLIKTYGQHLFLKYTFKRLTKESNSRIKEIIRDNKLIPSKIPRDQKIGVVSVNDPSTIKLLRELQPDIVLVNGTRIIKKEVLQAIPALFINIHSGITPDYRGYGGAYWALVERMPAKCGSTVHLINEGIDTGDVLQQKTIKIGKDDNYVTYLFLQLAVEIEMLKEVITAINLTQLVARPISGKGRLYYEPTIWTYWYNRIVRKVR